jgi:hypothetical protein
LPVTAHFGDLSPVLPDFAAATRSNSFGNPLQQGPFSLDSADLILPQQQWQFNKR